MEVPVPIKMSSIALKSSSHGNQSCIMWKLMPPGAPGSELSKLVFASGRKFSGSESSKDVPWMQFWRLRKRSCAIMLEDHWIKVPQELKDL